MIQTKMFDESNKPTKEEKDKIVNFLYTHLEEFGDKKKYIQKALDYSINENSSFGGFTFLLIEKQNIIGATVINKTGMGGYIPENILVYIATHKEHRGKGLGKKLMQFAIENSVGDIALHVEAENPARHLYKKMGFTNPYLEMRLRK